LNPDERLAGIVAALDSAGLTCLVMGGHAVRHYGLQRYTNDFDFTLAPGVWNELTDRLAATGLFRGAGPVEGNTWRPESFRRFLIGHLPGGGEERLEFWRGNHLLAPFPELLGRREIGVYAGLEVSFLALEDLIRSKETERAKDWEDISFLEEFLDARLRLQSAADTGVLAIALAQLRSRRGFDTYLAEDAFGDQAVVRSALAHSRNPVSQAFLLPWDSDVVLPAASVAIEPLVERKLRSLAPASPLHRSLVEVVRRQYKVACQDRDRADKEATHEARRKGQD
jgi:hypothetical protein